MKTLGQFVLRFVALLILWLLLWGRITPASVVGGFCVIAFVLAVAPAGPGKTAPQDHGRLSLIGVVVFAVVFAKALVIATWQVAVAVVFPNRVKAQIVKVQLTARSPLIGTTVANAVTLTPGTMTIDEQQTEDGIVLWIHALMVDDPEDICRDVRDFERYAVAAWGSKEDRQRLQRKS
ncbi:MAG: hypothetical protein RLZZ31_431 [Actinomycetota bacterium]|jgi:multicomponent Na+:H+ antiporter subunit E